METPDLAFLDSPPLPPVPAFLALLSPENNPLPTTGLLKHLHAPEKRYWSFTPSRTTIFIGDVDLHTLPIPPTYEIQLESFPNLTIYHTIQIFLRLPSTYPEIRKVILAIGFNSGQRFLFHTFQKSIRRLFGRAKTSFPEAALSFLLPPVTTDLSQEQRAVLESMNSFLFRFPHVPPAPQDPSGSRHEAGTRSRRTANTMWHHLCYHLNLGPPSLPSPGPAAETPRLITTDNNLLNLSTFFVLSNSQKSLLSKGLSFIPSLNIATFSQKTALLAEVSSYHRRLKLAAHFMDREDLDSTPAPFMGTSDWEPRSDQIPSEIRSIIARDTKKLRTLTSQVFPPPPQNLTQDEVLALRTLQCERQIVIKPADKGAVTVIMDRDKYILEGERQLNDTHYYAKLPQVLYPETKSMITSVLDGLLNDNHITARQYTYLSGDPAPKQRHIYFLPKIHKDPSSWPVPHEVPAGRPIVSDCGSETYRISEYIDYFLKPLSSLHPSYIRDTYDFVDKLRSLPVYENDLLFSMDVDSLYTNIEADMGLSAVRDCLERNPLPHRPDTQILELLRLSLVRNDFDFNGQTYLQVKGVAMGKIFAPSLADIFMARWESEALNIYPLKPSAYFRYLDDIWGVWPHSEAQFREFALALNSHNPSISLKYSLDATSTDFLDVTTFKGKDFGDTHRLDSKVFFKATDTHALLYRTSYHPKHTFRGIVKSQLLRFHRICSQKEDFERATQTLFRVLKTRGYTRTMLRQTKKDFLKSSPHPAPGRHILPVVTTFNPRSTRAAPILKANLRRGLPPLHPLGKHRPLMAYKRNPNLQDLLVRSRLPTLNPTRLGNVTPVYRPFHVKRHVSSTIPTPSTGSLKTTNCVYLIRCRSCGAKYVGETRQTLGSRLAQHTRNIRLHQKATTSLVAHFIHHGVSQLSISVLQENARWSTPYRKYREKCWIGILDTYAPQGLNDR